MIKRIGDRIVLVGVAHVLPESKKEVKRVIEEERPGLVGVELCRNRYMNLITPSDGSSGLPLSRTGILARIMQFIQNRIGQKTGMLPGDEMLAAIKGAENIGANVQLIDRDINVTLQRLISRMPITEKIKIAGSILVAPFLFSGDDIELEDITKEEVVEDLVLEMKRFSNTIYEVMIEERNKVMARRIANSMRSGENKMVAVVGAGHVPGLSKILGKRLEEGALDPVDEYSMDGNL